jgi:pilus assembly protein CpaB
MGRFVVSSRSIIIGVLALVFGGSAAIGVNILFNQPNTASLNDSVAIVVARGDIPRGVLVSPDQVKTRNVPKELVPDGAITNPEEVVQRVALNSLVKEEPFIERKLGPRNGGRGLAPLVPTGMRAFSIQTPHVATQVAGFILPGNKVDVLLTMDGRGPNDQTGGGFTSTLLQNVEILAVDQRLEAPAENRVDTKTLHSVTLLVTPDQANQLDLGQNRGTLHLSLRNPGDTGPAKSQPATLANLVMHQEKPWSEQIVQVIEAISKWRNPSKSEGSAKAVNPPEEADTAAPLEIRTVRGIHSGSVQVETWKPGTGRK